jgi:limonene-1,2-epoxide hydrolase
MAESTTPGLTERMRRFTDALEQRDFDSALGFFGTDPEWDMSAMGMGTFTGPVAIRGLLEDWTASYDEWEIEFDQPLDLGGGVVLASFLERGRPAGSTGRVQLRYAAVGQWAGDMILRVATYSDIDQARTAAERLAGDRREGSEV